MKTYNAARIMLGLEISDYEGVEYRFSDSENIINKDSNLILYPNPVSKTLNIKFSNLNEIQYDLIIKDISNKVVYNGMVKNHESKLDVSNWTQGVYIYNLIGSGKSEKGKFIIIH